MRRLFIVALFSTGCGLVAGSSCPISTQQDAGPTDAEDLSAYTICDRRASESLCREFFNIQNLPTFETENTCVQAGGEWKENARCPRPNLGGCVISSFGEGEESAEYTVWGYDGLSFTLNPNADGGAPETVQVESPQQYEELCEEGGLEGTYVDGVLP